MSALDRLFDPPTPPPEPPDPPLEDVTAQSVKTALRRRHPGADTSGGMPGQWTCIEEWLGIDLLALNAWAKADVIGYEVKVSRSDLRRELLKPRKRARAVAVTTEFYFAVPAGLLSAEEIAFEEPEWEPEDFLREHCPGVPQFGRGVGRPVSGVRLLQYGGRCMKWRRGGGRYQVRVPVPHVARENFYSTEAGSDYVTCWACGGKGHTGPSRVEREAPTCWVPRDVGLVTVSARGCRVVKRSPKRKTPASIAPTRKTMNDLVRWVSHRPDPRHRH